MALVAYLDESGDHSMKKVDPTSPIFCLTLALFDSDEYVANVVPAFTEFKFKYFGHDGVVLHSHEIRKSKNDFSILLNPTTRAEFMTDLSELMAMPYYELICIAVHKEAHAAQYAYPADPYELSTEFALERLYEWLRMRGENQVYVLAESRGKREDAALSAEYLRVLSSGTSFVRQSKFAAVSMPLRFITKANNLVGHQIADLAAYAVSKYAADRSTTYAPWSIVRDRIFDGRRGKRYGLKVFP